MVDPAAHSIDPKPACPSRILEQAVNNLSLGLIIFDSKREVVFCNKRYMEIYRLAPR
jgi:PAS domain-containing protein